MPEKADESNEGQKADNSEVVQTIDGDDNTTVGAGAVESITINSTSEEDGQITTDLGNILINTLRAIFHRIFVSRIGGYIDAVAAPLGLGGLITMFIGLIGYILLMIFNLGQGQGSPLFPRYINPIASFIETSIVPSVTQVIAATPLTILVIGTGIVVISALYRFVKSTTHCPDCNRHFICELTTIEYPRDATVDNEGKEKIPQDTKLWCINNERYVE